MTPPASYRLLTSEREYRDAIDSVLALADSELCILERNLFRMQLDDAARLAQLVDFMRGARQGRIRMVLHDDERLRSEMPRFAEMYRRHGDRIEIRRSPENLRHLADCHVIADGRHGVRRFHHEQPRAALSLNDPDAIHPWQQRFDELWGLTQESIHLGITGL